MRITPTYQLIMNLLSLQQVTLENKNIIQRTLLNSIDGKQKQLDLVDSFDQINNKQMKQFSDYEIKFIQSHWKGSLGMAMAPGKNYRWSSPKRNLEEDIRKIKQFYKIDLLICLLETDEMGWLQIPNQFEICSQYDLNYFHYPIEDMDAPKEFKSFQALVKGVTSFLKQGKRVLIHCQGGNGRTGLLVASCFIQSGLSVDEAIKATRQYRPHAIETRTQQRFLHSLNQFFMIF